MNKILISIMSKPVVTSEVVSEVMSLTEEALIIDNIYRLVDTGLNSNGEATSVFPWSGNLFRFEAQSPRNKKLLFQRRIDRTHNVIVFDPLYGFLTTRRFLDDTDISHVVKVTNHNISESDLEDFISSDDKARLKIKI